MDYAELSREFVYFLSVLVGAILLEHLAIGRNPNYRGRELFRRGLGIGTVLLLTGGWVYFGGGDWLTWGVTAAFFATAGIVLLVARRWEKSRKPKLGRAEGKKNERGKREGTEREITESIR